MAELEKNRLVFDCDSVIMTPTNGNYENAKPYDFAIRYINELYDSGMYEIVINTARYADRECGNIHSQYHKGYIQLFNQLKQAGLKFHQIMMGKPSYFLWIDDKACKVNSENGEDDWVNNLLPALKQIQHVNKYNQPLNTELEEQGELVKEFT